MDLNAVVTFYLIRDSLLACSPLSPIIFPTWHRNLSVREIISFVSSYRQSTALLSVYDKTGLLELATALHQSGVRLLGSGGTAKKIREAGIAIE